MDLEISDKSKKEVYSKVINNLIIEKFEYKNRLLKRLKLNYRIAENSEYTELLEFSEQIAEIAILAKMVARGNQEAIDLFEMKREKVITSKLSKDKFQKIKKEIIDILENCGMDESEYFALLDVALKLKDVYRYSSIVLNIKENVLFHQYNIAVSSLIFSEFLNEKMNENIDLYEVVKKSLFHDFGEYKGNEIVTHVKNYNDATKAMFKEIEETDENDLKKLLGNDLYEIIANYKNGQEGFISELIDKFVGIMNLWIQAHYMGNYHIVKAVNSVYQSRFKPLKRCENIDTLKNKEFYIDLLRECYIYIKENLIKNNREIFLDYFTEAEEKEFLTEIENLKRDKTLFLKD